MLTKVSQFQISENEDKVHHKKVLFNARNKLTFQSPNLLHCLIVSSITMRYCSCPKTPQICGKLLILLPRCNLSTSCDKRELSINQVAACFKLSFVELLQLVKNNFLQ